MLAPSTTALSVRSLLAAGLLALAFATPVRAAYNPDVDQAVVTPDSVAFAADEEGEGETERGPVCWKFMGVTVCY